jgi:DNA-directed RNA polymerase specialized sigma24 family protein
MERDRDAAWEELRVALVSSCGSACASAGLSAAEAEDIAHDGLARMAETDFATLRAAAPRVFLSSWSRGVARNLVRARLRDAPPSALASDPRQPEPAEEIPATGWEALDLVSLTDSQAEAIRARLEGRSERAAAATLGISRATLRDRVHRAVRALRRTHGELPPLPEMSRSWAEGLLDRKPSWLGPRDRKVLRLHAGGATRAQIAKATRLKAEGIRSLLRRLRQR